MTIFYRVQQDGTTAGLWYDRNGRFNNRITKVTALKDLDAGMRQMNPDPNIGVGWLSGCKKPHYLLDWFPEKDMELLERMGFKVYSYDVADTDFRWYERDKHWLFKAESTVIETIDWRQHLPQGEGNE